MRDRILVGLVALTLAVGLAVFAAPSLASDDSAPQAATIPVVEEPADPSIREIDVSEMGIEIGPLTPVPFPRFHATGAAADGFGSGVPPAPRVDAPAAPILATMTEIADGLEVPALTPMAFRSPGAVRSHSS